MFQPGNSTRIARSDAGRWGISLYHQLQGRLRRAPKTCEPEGERDKRARGRHSSRYHYDTGLVHVIMIQGAYLIPETSTRILSPQHLAEQATDHYTSKNITLFWSQRRFTKTVPLDPRTNVGLTTTAAGTRSYRAFCATRNTQETQETNIFMTRLIPDDEEESFQPSDPVAPHVQDEEPVAFPEQSNEAPVQGPMTTIVDFGPLPQVIPEDQLQGRLRRAPKTCEPEGERDKRARGRHSSRYHCDTGLVHIVMIQGAYLIPEASTRILSPQHLAEQATDHYTSKNITLFWSQRRFTKTVPLDPRTNVGLTTTAAGTRSYRAFCATMNTQETQETNIFTTRLIPDDEEESFQPSDPVAPHVQDEEPVAFPEQSNEAPVQGPMTTIVDFGPLPQVIPEDPESTSLNPHDELLRWHYCLGHLPFERIKQLARSGQLPKRILTCKKPFCAACQYEKMTKRPWRVKGDSKQTTKVATRPGQIVSVDQLESNSPGLIAQLKDKLTQQRYKYGTVFVDKYSGYTFVNLQRRLTSEGTVQAKRAFELSSEQHGVKILHYHADNGRLADNAFINDCQRQGQGLSYCGVNTHFQNGIAERRIRDLHEQTRTSMLYAMSKWKRMILICLWPYAMRHANDVANATPKIGEEISPLEKFSGVKVVPKLRHFHAFGCPTYVLDNAIQSGQACPNENNDPGLGCT